MSTINDVARLAGGGLGTASRVISGKGSVSAKTAERVRRAIDELEYRPSHAARTLPTGASHMIGVYIPMLKGAFYTPLLNIIHTELRANGQNMVVAFGSGNGDAHKQAMEGLEFLIERGCDGYLLVSDALGEDDVAAIGARASRLVLLNHSLKSIHHQCFCADHVAGGRLAAQALLEMKHRRIAVIAGFPSSRDNVARLRGFMDELRVAGIDSAGIPVIDSDFSPEGGWNSAAALIAARHKFTALFCANDEMGVGALSYFQQAGIDVPGRISVIGYDDTATAEYSAPRLTSVHIPWYDVALNGVRWLLNRCYATAKPVKRKFVVSVTWRASLARVPKRCGVDALDLPLALSPRPLALTP
jgi:LacI family transcriptional regulator